MKARKFMLAGFEVLLQLVGAAFLFTLQTDAVRRCSWHRSV
jgi:hypothetical protein